MELSTELEKIQDAARKTCELQMLEYRGKFLPTTTTAGLAAIIECKTVDQARKLAERIVSRSQIHFLAEWSKKRIQGKVTARGLEKEIKKADQLANFLDKRELREQAASQRERAQKLQNDLDKLGVL